MIKGLIGNCGITVSSGSTALPSIPTNPSNPMQGMLRVNNSDIEVFNGNSWQMISTTTVTLNQDILDVIQWARTQRQLEQNRTTLVKNNPSLQKAYDAVVRAEENFDLLSKFVEAQHEPGIVVGYNFNTP